MGTTAPEIGHALLQTVAVPTSDAGQSVSKDIVFSTTISSPGTTWLTGAVDAPATGALVVLSIVPESLSGELLPRTGDTTPVEASPHGHFWGVRVTTTEADTGVPWHRLNLLREALRRIRDKLRTAVAEAGSGEPARSKSQRHLRRCFASPPTRQSRPLRLARARGIFRTRTRSARNTQAGVMLASTSSRALLAQRPS